MDFVESLVAINKRLQRAPRLPWDEAGAWAVPVRGETISGFPEELRANIGCVPMYVGISHSLQARSRQAVDGGWEIVVDRGLIFTLAQLSLAFGLFMSPDRRNEDHVFPRLILAARSYLEGSAEPFVPVIDFYTHGLLEGLDPQIQMFCDECFEAQLRFVLSHELCHIVLDHQMTGQSAKSDMDAETEADKIAALAVSGYWTGDYGRGMARLGYAAVLIGFLGFCQFIHEKVGTYEFLESEHARAQYCGACLDASIRYKSLEHGLHTLVKWNVHEKALEVEMKKCLFLQELALRMYDQAFGIVKALTNRERVQALVSDPDIAQELESKLQKFRAFLDEYRKSRPT